MAIDVSIIIVAWNVKKLLLECLRSVYAETRGIQFEVIYVDNASQDGSADAVRQEFPEVKIIENTENKGFIVASNQGIQISRGRYVLLLNSDTLVLENAIAKTVHFADDHPQAAVIGCKVLNPDLSLQPNCFMYPSVTNLFLSATYLYKLFPGHRFFTRERMLWWDFNDSREVETICGCYSMVRKKAIEEVGLMDEVYFVYGDDPDWCYRFQKKGWKILYTPDASIIHYGGQNTQQMADKFLLQLYGTKLIFFRKFRSRPIFITARVLVALFFLVRVPGWLLVGILKKPKRVRSFTNVRTYLKGSLFSLFGWENLLMNKKEVKKRFSQKQD